MKKLAISLTVGLLFVGFAWGQQSVNTGGGDAAGTGGTVSYTIGQVVFNTGLSGAGFAAQGVQHAYETYTVGMEQNTSHYSLIVFPIPTTNILTIKINNNYDYNFHYDLFNGEGKLVSYGHLSSDNSEINMSSMVDDIYHLILLNEGSIVEKIQIIKTNKL